MEYLDFEDELEDFEVSDDDLMDMTTNTFNNFGRGNKTTKWKKENVMDEKIYGVLKKKKRTRNERTDIY